MGTETASLTAFTNSLLIKIVKLNNPLMGTETVSFGFQRCEVGYLVVKLNNPQMGTETMRIYEGILFT